MLPAVTGRLSAETIPLVTVTDSPNGEPKATTGSPIINLFEFPIVMALRLPRLILKTARSYVESRQTIEAFSKSPLLSSTLIVPVCAASLIT